jgi:ATP-binding cassette, subfamily G (WHITE), member 2, SNQ2
MWASHLDQDRLQRVNSQQNQWHRGDPQPDAGRLHEPHPTEEVDDDSSRESRAVSGTWGERDVGEFNAQEAALQFAALRRNLTELSRTRTKDTQTSLRRTVSGKSNISRRPTRTPTVDRPQTARTASIAESARDDADVGPALEAAETKKEEDEDDEDDDLELDQFLKEGHFEKRNNGKSEKKVGVIYKNLTVKGVGSTASFVKTLPDAIIGTFGPDLYRIISRLIPSLAKRNGELRTIIHDFTGCVRDGEMMLVLGRPGAGCSSFLKAVTNSRGSFAEVTGDVSYGGIPAEKQKKLYRGEVNYNMEDDVHFASLNVWQTFTFALLNKTKKKAREEVDIIANALLKMFGIAHTKYTLVGDEYTRGVSGGERKRVSIAETLASKATVIAWDNSTRGLDASTALDYARSLRIMTDVSNRTTITTLYQAGEGIYELMDKVLVIDDGRQIFMGPAKEARQYFIDLGFEAPDRQTTAGTLRLIPGASFACP